MVTLLLLVSATFCVLAGAALWNDWKRRNPQGVRRFLALLSGFRPPVRRPPTAVPQADLPEWQIRWGDDQGSDIELSLAVLPANERLREIPLRIAARQTVPIFVLSAAGMFGIGDRARVLRMIFSPGVAAQLRRGELDVMRRSLGKKPLQFDPRTGKIREIGEMASGVTAFAAISLAWEADAYRTAGKHLASIRQNLGFVAAHAAEVKELLLEQHEDQVNASSRYLLQIAVSAEMGNLSPEEVVVADRQLESIEQQLAKTFFVAETALQRRIDELRQTHDPELWKLEDLVLAAKFEISYFAQFNWLALLALQTRAAATHMRMALPLGKDAAPRRIDELSEEFARCRNLQRRFFEKIRATEIMENVPSPQPTGNNARRRVEALIETTEQALSLASAQVEEALTCARSAVHAKSGTEPLEIYARIEGGEVTLVVDEGARPGTEREVPVNAGSADPV